MLRRVVKIMSGFGLSINGQHVYCGDFIFSGHTMILILSYLIISECKHTSKLLKRLYVVCVTKKSTKKFENPKKSVRKKSKKGKDSLKKKTLKSLPNKVGFSS